MHYGFAIESMKAGHPVARENAPDCVVFIEHRGSPLQYFRKKTSDGMYPFVPSTEDQLAEDWLAVKCEAQQ